MFWHDVRFRGKYRRQWEADELKNGGVYGENR
jgi:hypothetical protein